MRIAYWDIETTDLNGEFGRLICACVYSEPGGLMKTFRQDSYIKRKLATGMEDDRQLAIDLRDFLETHHMTSGWFSKGFDIPFLQTRLVAHGERPMVSLLHLDGNWYMRGWRGLKGLSSKLKHAAVFFNLSERKPDVEPQTWIEARAGKKKAMDEVVDRCMADVRLTKEITEKILDTRLVRNIGVYP